MSNYSDTTGASAAKPESVLSMIDRIVQFRFALIVASLVLAVDVGQIPLHALGFTTFNWFDPVLNLPTGAALVFFCCYVFFVAALSPALQLIAESLLVISKITPLLSRMFGVNREEASNEWRYRLGYVNLKEALTHALASRDDFWIKRVDEQTERQLTKAKDVNILSRLSFTCIVLGILDWQLCSVSMSWLHKAGQWI